MANVRNGLRASFSQVVVVTTDVEALQKVERALGRAGLCIPNRVRIVRAGEDAHLIIDTDE